MKEDQIIERLEHGDYHVFRYLYRHYGMIENYILKNSGSKADAGDIFQNALIVFYERIRSGEFERSAKIGTFLFAVSKNLWLKHLSRKKEILHDSESMARRMEGSAYTEPLPEEEVSHTDQAAYVQRLLSRISKACRRLIELFHFEEMGWEDIAGILGYKSAHAARQQKYKCFLKIRKLISTEDKMKLFGYGD